MCQGMGGIQLHRGVLEKVSLRKGLVVGGKRRKRIVVGGKNSKPILEVALATIPLRGETVKVPAKRCRCKGRRSRIRAPIERELGRGPERGRSVTALSEKGRWKHKGGVDLKKLCRPSGRRQGCGRGGWGL